MLKKVAIIGANSYIGRNFIHYFICCKIKLPNVANAKSRKLQVEIP